MKPKLWPWAYCLLKKKPPSRSLLSNSYQNKILFRDGCGKTFFWVSEPYSLEDNGENLKEQVCLNRSEIGPRNQRDAIHSFFYQYGINPQCCSRVVWWTQFVVRQIMLLNSRWRLCFSFNFKDATNWLNPCLLRAHRLWYNIAIDRVRVP